MTEREKVRLQEAQETLLITLYTKAQPDNPILFDPHAAAILERIEYDFAALKVPKKTWFLVGMRAKQLDHYTREFLAEHPQGRVIQLGCGLDSRCLRIEAPEAQWVDLDLPDVIALRRKFFEEREGYQLLAASATDLRWLEAIPAEDAPTLVLAEGLFMYLPEDGLKALVLALHERFAGGMLIFDAFSTLTARHASKHPSLKQTGASIQWGIDDPREIEQWCEGIRFVQEWFFSTSPDIDKLSFGYRLAYKLAGLSSTANRAHRILRYTL